MSGLANAYDLKDETQAKEYLDNLGVEYRFQCYKENRPDGCHRLADFLEAFRNDVVKAKVVFETNCKDNKFGHSCFKAGNYSLLGKGGDKNVAKALDYFKLGCDNGYNSACHNAGLVYSTGIAEDKKKDYTSAVKYFSKGCEQKYGASCQELSALYISGKSGIPKDMSKAFEYGNKACELGHMYACANVSVMYKRGDGVKRDFEKAEQYKERAKSIHEKMTQSQGQLEFGK